MKKTIFLVFTSSFAFICLIMLMLFMIMSEDLNSKIKSQEMYIKELEWENSQHTMYCEVEK